MPTDTVVDTHAETIKLDAHELVRRLVMHLGPSLVAILAGSRDSKLPHRWAKADGPMPRPAALCRLQTAHRVWMELSAAESDHVARAWFIGANPYLDEDVPPVAIAADRHREVIAAARMFLDGTVE